MTYPIPISEIEALNYLTVLTDPEFKYNNINCYDIIDYEKLFFIEVTYNNNQKIQELLKQVKSSIAFGYALKNKYRNRILDIPPTNKKSQLEESWKGGYYGIPDKFK